MKRILLVLTTIIFCASCLYAKNASVAKPAIDSEAINSGALKAQEEWIKKVEKESAVNIEIEWCMPAIVSWGIPGMPETTQFHPIQTVDLKITRKYKGVLINGNKVITSSEALSSQKPSVSEVNAKGKRLSKSPGPLYFYEDVYHPERIKVCNVKLRFAHGKTLVMDPAGVLNRETPFTVFYVPEIIGKELKGATIGAFTKHYNIVDLLKNNKEKVLSLPDTKTAPGESLSNGRFTTKDKHQRMSGEGVFYKGLLVGIVNQGKETPLLDFGLTSWGQAEFIPFNEQNNIWRLFTPEEMVFLN